MSTISRFLQIIGLFSKRALQKRPIFCKEIYDFKEPTNRSHPIPHRHSVVCMRDALCRTCVASSIGNIEESFSHVWRDVFICDSFIRDFPYEKVTSDFFIHDSVIRVT